MKQTILNLLGIADAIAIEPTGCPNKHGNWETTYKSSLISDIKCMAKKVRKRNWTSDEHFKKWSTLFVSLTKILDIKRILIY